jgi:Ni,Fe-hydrogenase I cytochrome b subunit
MAVRTKKYPITKKDVCILLIPIAFVVVSGLIMYVLSSSEGIFWGILGIMSTVALGVLLFLMQMSADRQTNEIIRKQNDRYI